MSEEEGTQVLLPPRPTQSDPEAWKIYRQGRGQPWRTEPEIFAERMVELAQCRSIVPNIEKGIYPFKNIKLSRADIEWLLATHENGRGPVDWSDGSQRQGLDLRGAHLSHVDLSNLPLAKLRGGLVYEEWKNASGEQRAQAAVLLNEAILTQAQLQQAQLTWAQLQHTSFFLAQLQQAQLSFAQLQQADFVSRTWLLSWP